MNVTMNPLKMVPGGVGPLLAIFSILFYVPTHAQIAIRGQINSYAAVTGFDVCANKLTVATTAGFQPGNVVLLVQMQGATINNAIGDDFSYNNAGSFERGVIAEIQGNTISFTKDLIRSYDSEGSVQMVSVPQYGNVFVLNELTAAPWDATTGTGGILAFEASGTVDLRANINVNGKGFKGGAITTNTASRCGELQFRNVDGYSFSSIDWRSAFKGEGIAAIIPGQELGRGVQANGGGGGNDHNSGGGGGGSYGAGGIGGENDEPNFFNCRGYNPGLGGDSVRLSQRIFMGGGGGGGHSNNNFGTPGGNGGGIIYIKANTLTGNNKLISANGITALDGFGDGIGGGGGGGAILLDVANINAQNLIIEAKGGNGGNANNWSSIGGPPENRCFGPGGGGGGGFVAISGAFDPTEIIPAIAGGEPGVTQNSTASCNGTSNGALSGNNGTVLKSVFVPTGLLDPGSGCFTPTPVDYLYFKLQPQDNMVHLEWATAREKDNDYFSIERSENGKDFYEIARVSGKGTYNGVSTYTINDNNPLFGLSYYRIKQVDYDRKSAYTGIEPVQFSAGEMLLSVYPNPVQSQDNLNISIYSPLDGEATLRIYTLLGEEKYTSTYGVTKGAQKLDLPMNNFSTGWYVIHLQIGNYYKVHKIKVVR
jgi:hypothetical protein